MANAPKAMFDIFTGDEAATVERAIATISDRDWAKPIVADINANGGLTGKNMDKFFELRFGHALETAGISPQYEISGEADSTLDFGFTSKEKPWAVELMRLNETQAAKAATVELEDDGIAFVKRILSSNGSDPRQSPEGETLKTIQRICQKCEQGGKPHKFPLPNGGYNALLVDMRNHLNGGDVYDRIHIALATERVRDAALYITKLPKAEHDAKEWQAAMEALLVAEHGGPTMFARIGFMRALNRQVERVFDPARKNVWRPLPEVVGGWMMLSQVE
jgi:hypothetical protein